MGSPLNILNNIFHNIQMERGLVALYIGSNDEKFLDNVITQFNKTDKKIKKLKKLKNEQLILKESHKLFVKLTTNLSKIQKNRNKALSLEISVSEVIDFYSNNIILSLIQLMISLSLAINNHNPTAVNAYAFFLQWKEKVGLERAITTKGFISHDFSSSDFLERILFLLGEQDTTKNLFLSLATKDQQQLIASIYETNVIKKLQKIHRELKTNPNSAFLKEMQAKDWFNIISAKINALNSVSKNIILTLDDSHKSSKPDSQVSLKQKKYYDFILNLEIFANVAKKTILSFMEQGRIYKIRKNKTLFFENSTPTHLHIIVSGWVKIYKVNKNGKEFILQIIDRGNCISAATIFLNNCFYTSAKTISNTTLLSIPMTTINKCIRSDNKLTLNILKNISKYNQELEQKIEIVKLKTVDEKVGYFLLELLNKQKWLSNKIKLPYNKSLIALYLGISREGFSRSLSLLKKQGFSIEKNIVTIPTGHPLCKYCDSGIINNCHKHHLRQCYSRKNFIMERKF